MRQGPGAAGVTVGGDGTRGRAVEEGAGRGEVRCVVDAEDGGTVDERDSQRTEW